MGERFIPLLNSYHIGYLPPHGIPSPQSNGEAWNVCVDMREKVTTCVERSIASFPLGAEPGRNAPLLVG